MKNLKKFHITYFTERMPQCLSGVTLFANDINEALIIFLADNIVEITEIKYIAEI